jgi:hypothetical protein
MRWETADGQAGLSPEHQRLVKRAAIDIKIVNRESDEDAKFDLFQRLNTGGSQLSDQEVRNCLLIMEDPEFYRWLTGLQVNSSFQSTVAVSDRARDERYDAELVLRFLALKGATPEQLRTVGDMKDFLDRRSRTFARDPDYDWDAEKHAWWRPRCRGNVVGVASAVCDYILLHAATTS